MIEERVDYLLERRRAMQQRGDDAEQHLQLLLELSQPGEALDHYGTYATIFNYRWFDPVDGWWQAKGERRALHEQILFDWELAFPRAAQGRQAIVIAGPALVEDKEKVRRDMVADSDVGPSRWRVATVEDFIDRLLAAAIATDTYHQLVPPEIEALAAEGETFWPRELTPTLFHEANLLFDEAVASSIARGYDLILHHPFNDRAQADALMNRFDTGEYNVRIATVDVPRDVLMEMIERRWREGYEAAREGELGPRWYG